MAIGDYFNWLGGFGNLPNPFGWYNRLFGDGDWSALTFYGTLGVIGVVTFVGLVVANLI